MALCPFAVLRLIEPGANDPRIVPRVAILHVDAGDAASLFEFFSTRSGGVESHFHIRRDGVIEQYRDTQWQADANRLANDFAVSIETQGFGAGEWTSEQLASIKRLLSWLNEAHGIPLRKVDRWDGSGVGYHTQFGAPGPWTPGAKSCPGPDRIRQYETEIVPWFNGTEEGHVTPEDIKAVADAVLAKRIEVKRDGTPVTISVEQVLRETFQRAERIDYDRLGDAVAAKVVASLTESGAVVSPLDLALIKAAVKDALREGTG